MPLVIIKADEVHDGEPRMFLPDEEDAALSLRVHSADDLRLMLHLRPHSSYDWCKAAIVDRHAPTVDPRREAFWSAAFCAALTTRVVDSAASVADLALDEWDCRWGGAK